MDNELRRMLVELEDAFNECKFYFDNVKNFNIKDKHANEAYFVIGQQYNNFQHLLYYKILILRALRDKLENG
jgi:hypothetical protein